MKKGIRDWALGIGEDTILPPNPQPLIPNPCLSPLLSSIPHLRHGFFTRNGGISEGNYASLNCGPGSADNPAHVAENRARVAQALGAEPQNLRTLYQVHGNKVAVIPAKAGIHRVASATQKNYIAPDGALMDPRFRGDDNKADAMVTATPGLALGILTADCAPVLLADMRARVIGAAHAGWKGALSGVLEATIDAMEALGADRLHIAVAIGPCIHQHSYEVGDEFRARFLQQDAASGRYFIEGKAPGKWQFSLAGYLAYRFTDYCPGNESGQVLLEILNQDTFAEEKDFFSFRRTTLRAEADYGRQISTILIRD